LNTGSRNRPKLLLLFGPTASGKSGLLDRLFSRPSGFALPPAEIISADSMQVYRGMDIGTAKPGKSELLRLRHHLIDIRDPDQQFNVGEFCQEAQAAAADIRSRGKLPVVSGGTAFYLKTLMFGMPPSPPSDPGIRQALQEELRRRGAEELMRELAAADPAQAARIHLNDGYRLTRALEVIRLTGRPLSSFAVADKPRDDADFLCVAISRDRQELLRRIDARVEAMFEAGLGQEVARLCESGYGLEDPGMQAIGYREFLTCLPGTAPEAVMAEIKKHTRQYAKRQLTFFRSLPNVEWHDAADESAIAARIAAWAGSEAQGEALARQ
jgi:tRNA dimethylallyltransferase